MNGWLHYRGGSLDPHVMSFAYGSEEVLFVENIELLLVCNDLALLEHLHGVRHARALVTHELDAAKRACAKRAKDLEVGKLDPVARRELGLAVVRLLV